MNRIQVLSFAFAEGSANAYERFLETKDEILKSQEAPERLIDLENVALIAGIQAVVMSSMCFEAAIFDFAATQLGDRYVKKYLDRLDLVAKWVVIPKVVCGKEIRTGRVAFATFKELVTERNRLVHWKSKNMRWGDPGLFEELQQSSSRVEKGIHKSFRAIVLMSLEMDEVVGSQFNPLPCCDRERVFPWRYSSRIGLVIDECCQLFQKKSHL